MINLSNFGARLKDLTHESGKEVKDICEELDIKTTEYYQWWSGNSLPDIENSIKLANYFKCSLDYLFDKTEKNDFTEIKILPDFSKHLKILIKSSGSNPYRLSKLTGISHGTFYKWFNKVNKISVDSIDKLADGLDCSMDCIVGRE